MPYTLDRRAVLAGLAGAAIIGWPTASVHAQDFPTQPVSLIVAAGAGGPADLVARLFAKSLSDELQGNVVVENRPGGSGIVASQVVIESKPDGYTLFFSANTAFSVLPAIRTDLPYDIARDITIVSTVAQGPQALLVRSSLGVNSIQELIERAKAAPDTMTIASTGPGNIIHMAAEMFKYYAGIDITIIPYSNGGAEAVKAMLGGEVDMMVNDLSATLPYIKSGELKALAISNDKRLDSLPDTPTFAEVGLPEVVTSSWFATGAPAKTPAPVIETLNRAAEKAVNSAEFKDGLAKIGLEPFALSQDEASKFIAAELSKWTTLVAKANIKLE